VKARGGDTALRDLDRLTQQMPERWDEDVSDVTLRAHRDRRAEPLKASSAPSAASIEAIILGLISEGSGSVDGKNL
jgi:hypothetical protein